jgi:hypothetical protein
MAEAPMLGEAVGRWLLHPRRDSVFEMCFRRISDGRATLARVGAQSVI